MRYASIFAGSTYAIRFRSVVKRGVVLEVDQTEKRLLVQLTESRLGDEIVNVGEPQWFPPNRIIRTWSEHLELDARLTSAATRRRDATLRIAGALGIDPSRVVIGGRGTVTVPLPALERVIAALDVDWDQREEAV